MVSILSLYLGVDGGGSKTLAVLTDESGVVRGVGLGGPGNFQGPGVERARSEVKRSIDQALAQAKARPSDVAGAYFGMAGADRAQDFEIVRGMLAPIVPTKNWGFENDSTIGLWAETGDGVGVGVVCGSGTNVVGFNARGKRVQVGGMGYLFGDFAGGGLIGTLALRHAMRGHEGRGEPTALYDKLRAHYGLEHLIDLVDYEYEGRSMRLGSLAPIVFATAAEGDAVARQILIDVGTDLGVSAAAAIRQLFEPSEPAPVVGIGSVFQKATNPLMYDTFVAVMREAHPDVRPTVLGCEPVFGAVYAALRQAGFEATPEFKARLAETFPGRPDR